MSDQIAGYVRKTLVKVLIFVLLATPASLIAPQPALAAPTFTVTSAADVVASAPLNNGVCETAPGNNVCTLRAAIMKANHFLGGGVTINIPSGTYALTIPKSGPDDETTGNLNIAAGMSIIGVGSASAIIDGNASATNDNVIFVGTGVAVALSNVTIRNGRGDFGGGIYSYGGTVTLSNSTVSENKAILGPGAGIFSAGGTVLTLINSTVSGNNAFGVGGGIYNYNDSTLNVINSTISGNTSARDGGGIYNSGTSNLFNTTIAFNQADSDFDGVGRGGGVWNGGSFNFTNSLIALNSETVKNVSTWLPVDGDCAGTITSQGFSIVNNYDASYCTVTGSFTLADPLLGPLQNNGGATQTNALLAGSPAIDMGNNMLGGCKDNLGAPLMTDQRGATRPVNGHSALRCDIGAYEYFAKIPQTIAFSPLANKTFGDPSFSVSAAASSGLAVTFTAAGQCNVLVNLVALAGTGGCTVTSHQAGNSNYNAALDVPRSFTISARLYLPMVVN